MIHPTLMQVPLERENGPLSLLIRCKASGYIFLQNPGCLWCSLVLWYMLLDPDTSKNSCTKSNQESFRLSLLSLIQDPMVYAGDTNSGFSSTKSSILTGTLVPSRSTESCPWCCLFYLSSSQFLDFWPFGLHTLLLWCFFPSLVIPWFLPALFCRSCPFPGKVWELFWIGLVGR